MHRNNTVEGEDREDCEPSGSRMDTETNTEGCSRREDEGDGYIYVMQDKPDRFKVGCSTDPESRLRQLQTGNVDLRLVHKEHVSDHMQWRESQVHAHIRRKYRYHNPDISCREWYAGCTLRYLCDLIKQYSSREYQK